LRRIGPLRHHLDAATAVGLVFIALAFTTRGMAPTERRVGRVCGCGNGFGDNWAGTEDFVWYDLLTSSISYGLCSALSGVISFADLVDNVASVLRTARALDAAALSRHPVR
jgi:hypothetical protein